MQEDVEILKNRLNNYNIDASQIKIDLPNEIIDIHLKCDSSDTSSLKTVLQKTGNFEIYETYRLLDIFEDLSTADTWLKNSNLENNLGDSSIHPLFKALNTNFDSNAIRYCMIGTAEIKDTFRINELLNSDLVKKALPSQLVLRWGLKLESTNNSLALYALKGSYWPPHAPVLQGKIILATRPDIDKQTGSHIIIIQMIEAAASDWRQVTRNNIGHPIAMVLDGKVESAPVVLNEIANGGAQLTGPFSEQEAKIIAAILNSGPLPLPVIIQSFDKMSEK
jgi:hypothetical protein